MGFFDRLAKHEALFQGMNDRLGVDMADLVLTDAENAKTYRNAVLTCTSCTHGEACTAWQQSHAQASQTPDYCRNKALLETLAAK